MVLENMSTNGASTSFLELSDVNEVEIEALTLRESNIQKAHLVGFSTI